MDDEPENAASRRYGLTRPSPTAVSSARFRQTRPASRAPSSAAAAARPRSSSRDDRTFGHGTGAIRRDSRPTMNPITHGLLSWVLANTADLRQRERAAVTLAGVAPDL